MKEDRGRKVRKMRKDGRMEGWKGGRIEERKEGRKEGKYRKEEN